MDPPAKKGQPAQKEQRLARPIILHTREPHDRTAPHSRVWQLNRYGAVQGLPDTKVGTFTQELYDEAKKDGWVVVSMKNDWKRIFGFENVR